MALGDPVWGPSFERVYRAATTAIVWEPMPELDDPGWVCSECDEQWFEQEHDPSRHKPGCALYLPPKLARELVAAIASRSSEAPARRETRVCPP